MGEKADLKHFRRNYRRKLRSMQMELAGDEQTRRAASEAVKPTWNQIVATRQITIAKLEEYIADIEKRLAALKKPKMAGDSEWRAAGKRTKSDAIEQDQTKTNTDRGVEGRVGH